MSKQWWKDNGSNTAALIATGCLMIFTFWLFDNLMWLDSNSKHTTVCVNNDKKKNRMYLNDIERKKTITFDYDFTTIKSLAKFAEAGDTITFEMLNRDYKDSWSRNQTVPKSYKISGTGVSNMERRKQEFEQQIKADKEAEIARQKHIAERQKHITDSLRTAISQIVGQQRQETERHILAHGTIMQQNALNTIKAEEQQRREKHIADSIAASIAAAKEQARIKAQKEAEIARQKRDHETRKTIIKSKKDGTLWQYLAKHDTVLLDTATIVRVYSNKRFDASGNADYSASLGASYSANSSKQPIDGGGLMLGKIGFGTIDGGSAESHASGSANGHANGNAGISASYQEVSAVVARDKYGYTYTFPINPMMDVAPGDKIVLQYKGRNQTSSGYIDNIKLLHIIYQQGR